MVQNIGIIRRCQADPRSKVDAQDECMEEHEDHAHWIPIAFRTRGFCGIRKPAEFGHLCLLRYRFASSWFVCVFCLAGSVVNGMGRSGPMK